MARLKNFNGRYCESDYENAFLSFLEGEAGNISLAAAFPALPGERCCIRMIWNSF